MNEQKRLGISDDDVCSDCKLLNYKPGKESTCPLGFPATFNENGYAVSCDEMKFESLSFDGHGVNDTDQYRSRIATFTNLDMKEKYGKLFASAPELLEALCQLQTEWHVTYGDIRQPDGCSIHTRELINKAIEKATE